VLRGVDLDVPAGQRVAIVGRSGAGKSTLAAVLLRFLDPAHGSVRVVGADPRGTDTAAMEGDAVRRLIGLCAQDAYVFDSTVGANVRLARPDADDAQVRAALDRARLWDWVAGLPHGLDTPVGEHGVRLSGGQRQRLALARTLLADFPVVILDEPTEHLDEPTAAALTADLLTATAGRTVLLITHRTTGLDTCDAVYTLADGEIAR
jgi:ATP-binding cassette subfamily C protein CydCD